MTAINKQTNKQCNMQVIIGRQEHDTLNYIRKFLHNVLYGKSTIKCTGKNENKFEPTLVQQDDKQSQCCVSVAQVR